MLHNARVPLEKIITQLISNKVPNQKLILKNILADYISIYDDDVIMRLAIAIEQNTTLECVDIAGMDVSRARMAGTSSGATAIGNALKNHPSLKSVQIDVKSHQMLSFLTCLSGTAPIKSISIKFNVEDDDFLKTLAQYLKNNTKLESISIQGFMYSPGKYQVGTSKSLAEALSHNKTLTDLSINYIILADAGAVYLAKELINQTALNHLSLRNCALTAESMASLAFYFPLAKKLKHLDLSYNRLDVQGIECLTNQLPHLRQLHDLVLNGVGLDNGSSLQSLTTTIKNSNCPIKNLYMDRHTFNVDSMHVINSFITENRFLKRLSMNACSLGDRHLFVLKETLANLDKCHLKEFYFDNNESLSLESRQILLDILNSNPHLCNLLPTRPSYRLEDANDSNKNKMVRSQREFINGAITVAQGFYEASTQDNALKVFPFPREIMLLILLQSYSHTLGLNPQEVEQCCLLILQNLEQRAQLKNNPAPQPNAELSSTKNLDIKTWWSQTTRDDAKLRLFTQVKPLKEIESTASTPPTPLRNWCSII